MFCPFKSSSEWLRLKETDPEGWARAVEVDNGLRVPGAVVNRNLEQSLYVHKRCIPLDMVDLEADVAKERRHKSMFNLLDCGEGMCGV